MGMEQFQSLNNMIYCADKVVLWAGLLLEYIGRRTDTEAQVLSLVLSSINDTASQIVSEGERAIKAS